MTEETMEEQILKFGRKYAPKTNGCENCLGDLHQGCTEKCKQEFRDAALFWKELRSLLSSLHHQDCREFERIIGKNDIEDYRTNPITGDQYCATCGKNLDEEGLCNCHIKNKLRDELHIALEKMKEGK